MAIDKKITELSEISTITGNEVGVLASGNWDYQFTLSTLLQYISKNLNVKALTSFGAVLPQNISGDEGDVFLNTTNNSFAQKLNGQWTVKYQYQTGNANIIFSLGIPAVDIGNNSDVYIDTDSGIFYKKTNNAWIATFSMQSGPAGPPGIKGDTGLAGLDGRSMLSGISNPSNLFTGADGDFYINSSTWTIFGPKKNGAWTAATQIQTSPEPIKIDITGGNTPCPLQYSYDGSIGDNPNPRIKLKNDNGSFSYDDSVAIDHNDDGSIFTITGQSDANGNFLNNYVLIFYPGGSFSSPAFTQSADALPLSLPLTLTI